MSEIEKLLLIVNNPSEKPRTKKELQQALKLLRSLCHSKAKLEINFERRVRCTECSKPFEKDYCILPCKCLQTYHIPCFTNLIYRNSLNEKAEKIEINCPICNYLCGEKELKGILDKQVYEELIGKIKASVFKCGICIENRAIEDNCITLCCEHRFCNYCLKKYIELKIIEKKLPIKCPLCPKEIDYYIIKNIVSNSDFSQYDMLKLQKITTNPSNLMTNEVAIKCPHADCKMIFFIEKDKYYSDHTCERCSTKFCVNGCKRPHSGVTCQQFREFLKEDREADMRFEILMKKEKWAKCPGPGCGIAVERIKDCPHMNCIVCKTEFCYLDSLKWGICVHSK